HRATKNVPPATAPSAPRQTESPAHKSHAPADFSCSPQFLPANSAQTFPPSAPAPPLRPISVCTNPPNPSPNLFPPADPQSCRRGHQYPSHDAPQNAAAILSASPGTPRSHSGTPPHLPLCEFCSRTPGTPSAFETPAGFSLLSLPSKHVESLLPL